MPLRASRTEVRLFKKSKAKKSLCFFVLGFFTFIFADDGANSFALIEIILFGKWDKGSSGALVEETVHSYLVPLA